LAYYNLLLTIFAYRDLKPLADNCFLYSRALRQAKDGEANAKAAVRSRSTVAVSAKQESRKRLFEEKAASKLQSPRKQVSIVYS
jgi:hypothetical protein